MSLLRPGVIKQHKPNQTKPSYIKGAYSVVLVFTPAGEYVAAFRQQPHDPLNSLCIGLVFTHMACQKFAAKRHALTVQACAFLNQYLELRGECQESYYNLGRAMHQLGETSDIPYFRDGTGCKFFCSEYVFDM